MEVEVTPITARLDGEAGSAVSPEGVVAQICELADELSLLTNSGERIAQRFDRTVPTTPAHELPSGSVMNRLKAVR